MTRKKIARTALVALVQASLLASALAPAAQAQEQGQDQTPLVVDLSKDSPERTPGATPDPKTIEGGLWADSAKAEQQAKTSGERNSDPALDAWVASVESKVAGPFSGDIRVYVMDRPYFNADVSPNGYAEVWSGLLLRAQTEDQLAFVLGHETGHFRHSHSLKRYHEIKNANGTYMVASAVILIALAGAAANAGPGSYSSYQNYGNLGTTLIDVGYLSTVAILMSYSRDTEAQADSYGMTYATGAGYFPGAGAQLWHGLLGETAASDDPKVRRSPTRTNFFGSHPLETDRIDALNAQDRAAHGGQLSTRSEADEKAARLAYREHIRPFLGAWLKDDLRRKDYGETLFLIDQLSIDGQDQGVLSFYKGEAYRARGNASDLTAALSAYQKAQAFPDAPPETPREIGNIYRRMNDPVNALAAYKAYLAHAPNASDAWMIQDEVDTLSKTTADATPAVAPSTDPAAPAASSPKTPSPKTPSQGE